MHSAELGSWFTPWAARLKPRLGYRLVLTTWETILSRRRTGPIGCTRDGGPCLRRPTCTSLRPTGRETRSSSRGRPGADRRSAPGIDVSTFQAAQSPEDVDVHVIVSPGRLVWEKGHQDVIRALALIEKGVVGQPGPRPRDC